MIWACFTYVYSIKKIIPFCLVVVFVLFVIVLKLFHYMRFCNHFIKVNHLKVFKCTCIWIDLNWARILSLVLDRTFASSFAYSLSDWKSPIFLLIIIFDIFHDLLSNILQNLRLITKLFFENIQEISATVILVSNNLM